MDLLSTAMENGNLEHAQTELDQAYQGILESNAELNQQELRTRDLEDRLCVMEYRLGKLEDKVYRDNEIALEDYGTGCEGIETSSDDLTESSSHGTAQDNIPPCLQELYSRIGDLKILQDRLEDLEFEIKQTLRIREDLASSSQAVLPEDEFLQNCRLEENQIREELARTETDVQDLRELCLREGINPDDEIYLSDPEVHSEPFTVPPNIEDSTLQQRPFFPIRSYGNAPLTGHFLTTISSARDRINLWLKEILVRSDPETPIPDPEDKAQDWDSSWIKLTHDRMDVTDQQASTSSRRSLVASVGCFEASQWTLESHRSHSKLLRPIRSDPGLPTSRPRPPKAGHDIAQRLALHRHPLVF